MKITILTGFIHMLLSDCSRLDRKQAATLVDRAKKCPFTTGLWTIIVFRDASDAINRG